MPHPRTPLAGEGRDASALSTRGDAGSLEPLSFGRGASLPAALSERTFTTAALTALGAHLLLFALLFAFARTRSAPEEPLVRLVFVAPAPAPALPLGAPGGAGSVPVSRLVEPVAPAPREAVPPPQPVEPPSERLLVATAPKKAKAEPKPVPKATPRAKTAAAPKASPMAQAPEPAAGIAQGAVGGRADGSAGGVAGGIPGGIVGGTGTSPVPADQAAQPPVLVRRVEPIYPQIARRRRIEGLVLLEAILDREGKLEPDVKILESLPLLDQQAVDAVRQWRFRPARSGRQADPGDPRDSDPVRPPLKQP